MSRATAHNKRRADDPTRRYVALAVTRALTPPDPQRTSSPVRVYGPDGTLRETVPVDAWQARYPRRFAPRRSPRALGHWPTRT